MGARSETPPPAVGHTCLAIDRMRQVIRRSVSYGPDRDIVLGLLETLRAENQALRARLVWYEEEAAGLAAELERERRPSGYDAPHDSATCVLCDEEREGYERRIKHLKDALVGALT